MRSLRLCCALSGMLIACPVLAQEDPARDTDTQIWTGLTASIPLEGDLGLSLDATQRFSDDRGGLYETVEGFVLTLQLSDAAQIGAGYNHTTGFRAGPNTHENRLRQQVQVKFGAVSARLRLEERFRDDGGDMGWRTRLQLRAASPFRKGGKLQWVLYHESFVSLNDTDWGQAAGYSRTRNFAGLRLPIVSEAALEGGYLNQYDFKPGRDAMANIASLTLAMAF